MRLLLAPSATVSDFRAPIRYNAAAATTMNPTLTQNRRRGIYRDRNLDRRIFLSLLGVFIGKLSIQIYPRSATRNSQSHRAAALANMVLEQYAAYSHQTTAGPSSFDVVDATPQSFFHSRDDLGYDGLRITTVSNALKNGSINVRTTISMGRRQPVKFRPVRTELRPHGGKSWIERFKRLMNRNRNKYHRGSVLIDVVVSSYLLMGVGMWFAQWSMVHSKEAWCIRAALKLLWITLSRASEAAQLKPATSARNRGFHITLCRQ